MACGVYDQDALDILRCTFDDIVYQDQHSAAVRPNASLIAPVALARALLMTFDRGCGYASGLKAGTMELLDKETLGAVRWLAPALAARGVLFVVDCSAVAGYLAPAPKVRAVIAAPSLSEVYEA